MTRAADGIDEAFLPAHRPLKPATGASSGSPWWYGVIRSWRVRMWLGTGLWPQQRRVTTEVLDGSRSPPLGHREPGEQGE